ncbi:acyl-CoA dehydrogenase [Marinobacterium sp. YM272]|uniref:acyl-CoA dehydrogenase n=1 Tax=Marinobacterium sp. YM272 TaxID=3421654 RepID=UPI003D7F73B7
MLKFNPPLRDLQFVIHDVLDGVSGLAELPAYEEFDAETLDAIADEAGRFASEQLLSVNEQADRVGCRWNEGTVSMSPGFSEAWNAYRELGWPSMCAQPSEGGQGLPKLAFSVVSEFLSASSHAFVMIATINHCTSTCLRSSATPELQEKWIPALTSGEVLSSMCITEPQAGSDVGLLSTKAEPDGQGTYRLSGSKIFASGAEHDLTKNIVHLVLARIPGAPAGTRGLSLFLVPKLTDDGQSNGVHCDGIEHKMGLHGSPTCSLRFDNAQGWLVGEENAGLKAMFAVMNEARLLSGLQAVGMSETAMQNAWEYTLERRQGRSPQGEQPCQLIEHVDVQRMLLTQKAWTEAGRFLLHWTALLMDQAESHPQVTKRVEAADLLPLLTPIVKGFLSENAQESTSLALQLFGGHGYVTETGIEQLTRDVRITTIYEGTTTIQGQDLLIRKVLSDGGRRLNRLQTSIRLWLDEHSGQAQLLAFCKPLAEVSEMVDRVTRQLIDRHTADPISVLGACTAYLRLMGHLVFAWAWARMAAVALSQGDDDWYSLKVETARFYFNQLLPEIKALELAIAQSPKSIGHLMGASSSTEEKRHES